MMATGMKMADVKAALKSSEPRGEKSEQAGERNSWPGWEENTENITRLGSSHSRLEYKSFDHDTG